MDLLDEGGHHLRVHELVLEAVEHLVFEQVTTDGQQIVASALVTRRGAAVMGLANFREPEFDLSNAAMSVRAGRRSSFSIHRTRSRLVIL
jgi:hypothetical protein